MDKGGIDHSTTAFRVMHVDSKGDFTSELRYTYLDKNICIASPAGVMASGVLPVAVNVYSSVSPVKEVLYTCLADGKPVLKTRDCCKALTGHGTGSFLCLINTWAKNLLCR